MIRHSLMVLLVFAFIHCDILEASENYSHINGTKSDFVTNNRCQAGFVTTNQAENMRDKRLALVSLPDNAFWNEPVHLPYNNANQEYSSNGSNFGKRELTRLPLFLYPVANGSNDSDEPSFFRRYLVPVAITCAVGGFTYMLYEVRSR